MAKRTRPKSTIIEKDFDSDKYEIFYDKEVEEYLEFESLDQYMDAVFSTTLPRNPLILLKHLTEFSVLIELLSSDVFRHTDQKSTNPLAKAIARIERLEVNLNEVFTLSWKWYLEIANIKGEFTGRLAECRLFAWSQVCTLFYLLVYSGDEDYERYHQIEERCADQYPYCLMVQREAFVVISEEPILQYSLRELWESVCFITPSFYKHAYSKELKDYFYALLFRYASFFTVKQENLSHTMDNPLFYESDEMLQVVHGDYDIEEEEEEEDGEDGDKGDEAFDSYKRLRIPLGEGYRLKSEFFFDGEITFIGQMRRILLSARLSKGSHEYPLILEKGPVSDTSRVLARDGLVRMLQSTCTHSQLRQCVNEDFKSTLFFLYIYHGEAERCQRRWPNASTRPGDILAQLRSHDLTFATKVMQEKLSDIIVNPERSKETILLTRIMTYRVLSFHGNKRAEQILSHFLMEELISLNELEDLVEKALFREDSERRERSGGGGGRLPTLVVLMNTSHVIYHGNIHTTNLFIDAYMIWLSILVERMGIIARGFIHTAIREYLPLFIPAS